MLKSPQLVTLSPGQLAIPKSFEQIKRLSLGIAPSSWRNRGRQNFIDVEFTIIRVKPVFEANIMDLQLNWSYGFAFEEAFAGILIIEINRHGKAKRARKW